MTDIATSDASLQAAAARVRDAMLDALPSPSACDHTFSDTFEAKMLPLLQKNRRKRRAHRVLNRVAIVFLVLLLGASAFLALHPEARAAFTNWVREFYQEAVVYHFYGMPENPDPYYAPTWLPEGFEETDRDESKRSVLINYENKETGERLHYQCNPIRQGTTLYLSNNSDEEDHESFKLRGGQADYYLNAGPNDWDLLTWMDHGETHFFSLFGSVGKADMVRIVKSIEPYSPQKETD